MRFDRALAVLGLLALVWAFLRWPAANQALHAERSQLREELGRLSVTNARLSATLARLTTRLHETPDVASTSSTPGLNEHGEPIDPADLSAPGTDLEALYEQLGSGGRPRPLETPLLTDAERAALDAAWNALPLRDDSAILQGGLDALLADPRWNPSGWEPSLEERLELERLVGDYRFFARVGPVERVETLVRPELAAMHDAGAFVEFSTGETPPPVPEDVTITHAVLDKGNGQMQYYFFWPEEHPDLYHHDQVCRERSRETFVALWKSLREPSE